MKRLVLILICALAVARTAGAQSLEGCGVKWEQTSLEFVQVTKDHIRRFGSVEVTCADMKFFADEMELFVDKHQLIATGNVVFTQAGSRIGADRLEFDTKSRTGVFYNASGTVSLGDRVDRSMFGTQEPDAYFYGEKLEKIAEKTYRVTKGGFTTCVQPNPRWEVTSRSVTFTVDDHAFLKNSLLKVKGVPVFYLPIFYYPIQEDDRATGFLIPVYGTSTIRGQSVSNAFFWALGRSHDATFFHDWFSKTGQGAGAEYRYVAARGADGNVRFYWLNEHEARYTLPGSASETVVPARRSYDIRGGLRQGLPLNLRASADLNYFSDITVQQTYQTNIYDTSRRQRGYTFGVTGAWSGYALSSSYSRNDYFYGTDSSSTSGYAPRVRVGRDAWQIFSALPFYFSGSADYAQILRSSESSGSVSKQGFARYETIGSVRVPFSKVQFIRANGTVTGTFTRYGTPENRPDSGATSRRFAEFNGDFTGPILMRIWNRPDSRYASKLKHLVEPNFSVRHVTKIDNVDEIPKNEYSDYLFGGFTQMTYGVTNRLMVKPAAEGQSAREIVTVDVHQSYYTDARQSQYDLSYSTGFLGRKPSNFSSVSVITRVTPLDRLSGTVRLEYDPEISAFQQISTHATADLEHVQTTGGYSRRLLSTGDGLRPDNFIDAQVAARADRNRFGGRYAFNYDLGRKNLIQQRWSAYYNAQCCGVVVEYQQYNFPQFTSAYVLPQDRRFNISFTLAGVGTFSNLLGVFGGGTLQ